MQRSNINILSFLGLGPFDKESRTNKYTSTVYSYESLQCETEYIQEALSLFLSPETHFIACTDRAFEIHGEKLQKLINPFFINIPEGKNESELWETFRLISDQIPEKSHLVLDVTHGFRHQPMISLAISQYLAAVKNVEISKILYGAFEARNEHNIAPIFDLTSFNEIIEWSWGAKIFTQYGQSKTMTDLLHKLQQEAYQGNKPYKPKKLKTVANKLEDFTLSMALLRPAEAIKNASYLNQSINASANDLKEMPALNAYKNILETIRKDTLPIVSDDIFSMEGLLAQTNMINYCLNKSQFQQAITLARELLVTYYCIKNGYDPSLHSKNEIRKEAVIPHDMINSDRKSKDRKNAEFQLNEQSESQNSNDLISTLWSQITITRNNINHAGMAKQPIPSTTLQKNIKEFCNQVVAYIQSTP